MGESSTGQFIFGVERTGLSDRDGSDSVLSRKIREPLLHRDYGVYSSFSARRTNVVSRRVTDRRSAAATMRKKLGLLVTSAARERGMTLYRLAHLSGLCEQSVRDVAAGETLPRLDAVLALERALNVGPGWVSERLATQEET